MEEVELTSEFALLMLNGVSERTAANLNSAYRRYDESFPDGKEVARRFHTVMDTIDGHFDVRVTPFKNKTLFYGLFAAIYDRQFKLESALDRAKPRSLSPSQVGRINLAGERIASRDAPDEVIEATQRRTTQTGSRQRLISFLNRPA